MSLLPVAESYKSLGIDPKAVEAQPQITPVLRSIAKTIGIRGSDTIAWIKYLETSNDSDAHKITDCFRETGRYHSKRLPIEAFCVATGVPTYRVLELITAAVVRMGAQASSIIAAVSHPKVVKKTIEVALTTEGIEDRNTLHKATGFLPSPKGSQTNITVTQNANPQVAVVSAPPPEQTIRRLVDRFNAGKLVSPPPDKLEEENDDE